MTQSPIDAILKNPSATPMNTILESTADVNKDTSGLNINANDAQVEQSLMDINVLLELDQNAQIRSNFIMVMNVYVSQDITHWLMENAFHAPQTHTGMAYAANLNQELIIHLQLSDDLLAE